MKMHSSVQPVAVEELVSRLSSFDIFYHDNCNLLAGGVYVPRNVCEWIGPVRLCGSCFWPHYSLVTSRKSPAWEWTQYLEAVNLSWVRGKDTQEGQENQRASCIFFSRLLYAIRTKHAVGQVKICTNQDQIVYEVSKVGSLGWWQQCHRVPDSTLPCPFPLLLISRSAINFHLMQRC